MTILEKIKFEEDWLSEVNLTKENIKIAFDGIRATVLEQQPCEDCIRRDQAVYVASGYCAPQNIADELRKLPPVTPQQKTGHWIDIEILDSALWHKCSECGETEFYATNFCPNCGADMRGDEE